LQSINKRGQLLSYQLTPNRMTKARDYFRLHVID